MHGQFITGNDPNKLLVFKFGNAFLALRIRMSDILSWDRKSYLTHVILSRLSGEGCTFLVLELMRLSRQGTLLIC